MVSWAALGSALPASQGKWSSLFIHCCWTHTWSIVFSYDLPSAIETWTYWKGHKGKQRIGASFRWKTERAGIVYPGEDSEEISSMYINTPREGAKRLETWSFQWCSGGRTRGNGHKLKNSMFSTDITKHFLLWGWQHCCTLFRQTGAPPLLGDNI